MFLSVCFPFKISHFTMFFLDCKRVNSVTNCFSISPHVICTRIKNSVQLLAMIGNNRLFARPWLSK